MLIYRKGMITFLKTMTVLGSQPFKNWIFINSLSYIQDSTLDTDPTHFITSSFKSSFLTLLEEELHQWISKLGLYNKENVYLMEIHWRPLLTLMAWPSGILCGFLKWRASGSVHQWPWRITLLGHYADGHEVVGRDQFCVYLCLCILLDRKDHQ